MQHIRSPTTTAVSFGGIIFSQTSHPLHHKTDTQRQSHYAFWVQGAMEAVSTL
nr:MAG TPA: hypothetical protein [Caudoviricetes sp.]